MPNIVIGRDGRRRVLRDDEILADGERMVVPLQMMDAAQRAVYENSRRSRSQRTADTRLLDERDRAYADRQVDDENAWRRPPGSYPLSAGENSYCTTDEGKPGHLVRSDDNESWLICRADAAASASPGTRRRNDAQFVDERERAYREVEERDATAWQRPIRSGVSQ
jgi:hypothetical protein